MCNNKLTKILLTLCGATLLVAGVFALFHAGSVFAQAVAPAGGSGGDLGPMGNTVQFITGAIARVFVFFLGSLLWALTGILLVIAHFNNFIGSTAVSQGWSIIRDVCNMFFVLILLAIAIGTILQQEKYHYSKLLPQFIIAAVLINFSKTICGVFIDVSQVVMLTFVGAFSQSTGFNFAVLFGADKLLNSSISENRNLTEDLTNQLNIIVTYILAVVYLAVADLVVAIMVMVLIARIVMLWFFVVLSPFAFLLSILEDTKSYAQKWWDQFTNYVVVGPAMAFFLWLSLAVVQGVTGSQKTLSETSTSQIVKSGLSNSAIYGKQQTAVDTSNSSVDTKNINLKFKGGPGVGISDAGTFEGIMSFLLGIGMLIGTLMVSQQLGVAGGKMAGSAVGWMGDVAAGKKGFLQWNTAISSGFSTFEQRQAEPWTKRGQRAGGAAGQGTSLAIDNALGVNWALRKMNKLRGGKEEDAWQVQVGTKADVARRKEGIEHYRQERKEANIKSREAGHHIDTMRDVGKLQEMALKDDDMYKRMAATKRLMAMGALVDDEPSRKIVDQMRNGAQAKYPWQVLDAKMFSDVAHMKYDFEKEVKKANPNLAIKTVYGAKVDDKGKIIDISPRSARQLAADIKSGEFSSSGLTKEHIQGITNALEEQAVKDGSLSQDDHNKMKSIRSMSDEDYLAGIINNSDTSEKRQKEIEWELLGVDDPEERAAKVHQLVANDRKEEVEKLRGEKFQGFGNMLVAAMADDKEIKDKIGAMADTAKEALEEGMTSLQNVTLEQRGAFGKASGAWSKAFDFADKEKDDNGDQKEQRKYLKEKVLLKDIDGFMGSVSHLSLGNKKLMSYVLSDPYTKSWQAHGDKFYADKLKSRAFTSSVRDYLKEVDHDGDAAKKREADYIAAANGIKEQMSREAAVDVSVGKHAPLQELLRDKIQAEQPELSEQQVAVKVTEKARAHVTQTKIKEALKAQDAFKDFDPDSIGRSYNEVDEHKRVAKKHIDDAVAAAYTKAVGEGFSHEDATTQSNDVRGSKEALRRADLAGEKAARKIAHHNRMRNLMVTSNKGLEGTDSEGGKVMAYDFKDVQDRAYKMQLALGASEEEARDTARDAGNAVVSSIQHQISQNRMHGPHFEDTPKTKDLVRGDGKDPAGLDSDLAGINASIVLRMTNTDMGGMAKVHRKGVGDAFQWLNGNLKGIVDEVRSSKPFKDETDSKKKGEMLEKAITKFTKKYNLGEYKDILNRSNRLAGHQDLQGLIASNGDAVTVIRDDALKLEALVKDGLSTSQGGAGGSRDDEE